ncbi:MAG: nucleoside hydrolase [Candidatus Electrothrix sp. AW5]|nr:nucleoside hydrolase [Candidatus Electrothrix sp. AX1]MCI5181818.1 nucleoside hydrolase [Candidatus Electrothrix gigas]MCI5196306.1 nucleoside hydrolase [Candidatus Electrothrix gigas]
MNVNKQAGSKLMGRKFVMVKCLRIQVLLLSFLMFFAACTSASEVLTKFSTEKTDKITDVIIDTDMGVDDFMAVIWLLNQKRINIKAITVCTDGLSLSPYGAENAALLVKLVREDSSIKVYNGNEQTTPKKGYDRNFPNPPREEASKLVREVTGIKEVKGYSYDKSVRAPEAMYELIVNAAKNNTKLTILSIGTATNIVEAYEIASKKNTAKEFISGIEMVYKAGGSFGLEATNGDKTTITNLNIHGNMNIGGLYATNNDTAEWNIYAAAESMQKILESGIPVTFIPTNVSNTVLITSQSNDRLRKEGGKLGKIVADITDQVWVQQQGGWTVTTGQLSYWDPSAVVPVFYPEIITEGKTYKTNVCIQLGNPQFTVDREGQLPSYAPEGVMNYKVFKPIENKLSDLYYSTTLVGDQSYCTAIASSKSSPATVIMGINPDSFYDVFIEGFRQKSD